MEPVFAARLRRHWPVFASLIVLAVFGAIHVLTFVPMAQRYERAVHNAGDMGATFDPSGAQPAMPPHVAVLLTENSLPSASAEQQGQSGALAATLMQHVAEAADRHGLDVVVSEPGVLTQTPAAVEVRAHLRMRGRYAQFVEMVDALAHDGALYRIERFSMAPTGAANQDIELWVARLWLKRSAAHQ